MDQKKVFNWVALTAGAALIGIIIGKIFEKKEIQETAVPVQVDPKDLVYSDENIEL